MRNDDRHSRPCLDHAGADSSGNPESAARRQFFLGTARGPGIVAVGGLVWAGVLQISVLGLFIAGNAGGWDVLQGNLSTSRMLGTAPLADPYALLQALFSGSLAAAEALLGGVVIVLFFGILGGRVFCSGSAP